MNVSFLSRVQEVGLIYGTTITPNMGVVIHASPSHIWEEEGQTLSSGIF
jgi:hypothetical protein